MNYLYAYELCTKYFIFYYALGLFSLLLRIVYI